MAVTEDEEVDVGMGLQVFFGEDNQVFGRFAFVFLRAFLGQSAFAAIERPAEGKAESPAGMNATIQPLAEFVAEKGADKTERLTAIIHLVAVAEKEALT